MSTVNNVYNLVYISVINNVYNMYSIYNANVIILTLGAIYTSLASQANKVNLFD